MHCAPFLSRCAHPLPAATLPETPTTICSTPTETRVNYAASIADGCCLRQYSVQRGGGSRSHFWPRQREVARSSATAGASCWVTRVAFEGPEPRRPKQAFVFKPAQPRPAKGTPDAPCNKRPPAKRPRTCGRRSNSRRDGATTRGSAPACPPPASGLGRCSLPRPGCAQAPSRSNGSRNGGGCRAASSAAASG